MGPHGLGLARADPRWRCSPAPCTRRASSPSASASWSYTRALGREDLLPLALYSATALPLVVAITELGVSTGRMRKDNAAALIGAALLSVLIFPLVALALRGRAVARERAGRSMR